MKRKKRKKIEEKKRVPCSFIISTSRCIDDGKMVSKLTQKRGKMNKNESLATLHVVVWKTSSRHMNAKFERKKAIKSRKKASKMSM